MSIFDRFRYLCNALPDRIMKEIGAAFALFPFILLPPLLWLTSRARRDGVFPFSGAYILRFCVIYALLITGAIFFFTRTVAQPDFFYSIVRNTAGKDNMQLGVNISRGIQLLSALPPFRVENGLLTGDIPEEGLTLYDSIKFNGRRHALFHITLLETTGELLFPGNDDKGRPSFILHAAGVAVKQGTAPYEEKTYAELAKTGIGETALMRYFTDLTPPEGGYSFLDVINLAGHVGGVLPDTYYTEGKGFITADNTLPTPGQSFLLSEQEDTPRLYIDLAPGASFPDDNSPYLAVLTDKMLLLRARTTDYFTPFILTSLSQRDIYRTAGDVMRSWQQAVNRYLWPAVFPLLILSLYGVLTLFGIIGAAASCVLTRLPALRPVYRSGGSLCGAVLCVYIPGLFFAGLLRVDIMVAASSAFYIVLSYIDARRLRPTVAAPAPSQEK